MNTQKVVDAIHRQELKAISLANEANKKGFTGEAVAWNHTVLAFRSAIAIIRLNEEVQL